MKNIGQVFCLVGGLAIFVSIMVQPLSILIILSLLFAYILTMGSIANFLDKGQLNNWERAAIIAGPIAVLLPLFLLGLPTNVSFALSLFMAVISMLLIKPAIEYRKEEVTGTYTDYLAAE